MSSQIRRKLKAALLVVGGSIALAACGSENVVAPERQSPGTEPVAVTSDRVNPARPDLGTCDSLRVPAGHRLVATLYARGFQIYRWDGTSWVFLEPSARLFAGRHGRAQVGVHYAGPTWESLGGSKVVGAVSRRCPSSSGAIPWLLLSAASSEGRGIFRHVTFIQRLHTVGGLAPAQPGNLVGDLARVPYTADYAFYRER